MNYSKSLSEIEKEMLVVLTDGKSYWTKCYQLMRIVEKEQLYLEANYKSFTAWLKAFQFKAGVNISILWQQKKAGTFYESYIKKNRDKIENLPDIDTVKITPTNLNYIEKISESHPWLEDQLMKKAIDGNVTRRELKNTWDCIKAERIARGELKARETRHDKEKISVTIEEKISATKAMLCIQSDYTWLAKKIVGKSSAKYDVVANFKIEEGNTICTYDILIAETLTAGEDDIMIHGLMLLKEDTILNKKNMDAYQKFTDCFWVIIPDQYEEIESVPQEIGVISIHSNSMTKKIEVIRKAEYKKGQLKSKVIVYLLMRHLKNVD